MRILSLGAGVQSSTLLLMGVHGEVEIDRAIFADTGWEPQAVYDWLETLMPLAERAGIPIDVVTAGNIRSETLERASRQSGFASMPFFVVSPETGKVSMLRRQCTKEYKLRPIQRRLRAWGAHWKRPSTVLIGISTDEVERASDSRVKYAVHEHPLLDFRMSRWDCSLWLARHGYPEPPKSACIGCPFHDNAYWREMRDRRPDEWADAVAYDRAIRRLPRIDGAVYLHPSCRPLDQVDLSTPEERGQLAMFGSIECSPFNCPGDAA